jgi:hypothetical protein
MAIVGRGWAWLDREGVNEANMLPIQKQRARHVARSGRSMREETMII